MLTRLFYGALFLIAVAMGSGGVRGADDYFLGRESMERGDGVPRGRVERFDFEDSSIFPGTRRAGWVYIPAQLREGEEAALMVFQDGHAYVSETGQVRVPVVFDNLIASGELDATVGVFVNPGHRGDDGPAAEGWGSRNNRSFEYDSLSDLYVRFLLEELLPYVSERYGVKFSADPGRRAICGMSSGGICAFTAAWERPDSFGRVLSHIGSFVNIRGGHVYPALIRKTARKPIRVYLQDGSNDLNNEHGDWPLANQQMARALAFAGYDFLFEFGDGAHNGKHGGAVFPDALRWLWRDVEVGGASDGRVAENLMENFIPEGSSWELVAEGMGFLDAACADGEGNVYVSDLSAGDLWRLPAGGGDAVRVLENGPRISGMQFGADGLLYALSQGDPGVKGVVVVNPWSKSVEVVATGMNPNDLVVSDEGWIYLTDTGAGQVIAVPTSARGMSRPAPAAGGIDGPNGVALSRGGSVLMVSEYRGRVVWRYELGEGGALVRGERWGELMVPEGKADSGGDGMELDDYGLAWVTSHLGIQVMDYGVVLGVLERPQEKATVSCAFGGPGHEWLYVCSSDKVFRRRTSVSRMAK